MDVLLSRFVCSLPRSLLQNVFQKTSAILLGSTPEYLKPKGGLFEGHPTIKSDLFDKISRGKINVKPAITKFSKNSILFADGRKEEFDTVIFCTGYNIGFPFFDQTVIAPKDNKISLYKMIVPPTHRNIFFIGLVQPLGAIMPVAEIQTRWAISMLQRPELLPTPPSMYAWIAHDQDRRRKRYMASSRHTIEVDWLPYMDLLAKDIGCRPTFWRVLYQNRSVRLAFKTCFGTPKTEYFRILKTSHSCSKFVLGRLSTECDLGKE
ncbi:Dimethylaniline monooxygenase [N-oxide-forming] 5 [Neolecta irregularis DAH-3]|uniref:Dimethylaniline monooxygenase [N-oxide-forming] 5 n=1 Tax=Neolecta irregularis (strain DAH-3) TaxID=1198029 RepID=A0A1U7LHI5_NEOID|nr:Dimethylaniline monooxygenase [N-oxide-forming] 5 [Neolecta irregularis DAH-3]|eukprot:OLL22120.1 Dimethylaniline monooxygenase [N-oxide-forming] 5 [Neolecta irregularis DAH-3]